MAGIERLEIHSKSYIVRWVKVEEGYSFSWSVQPAKKSINFGVFKHPGTGGGATQGQPGQPGQDFDGNPTANTNPNSTDRFSNRGTAGASAQDLLEAKGFIPIRWVGKCGADKATTGAYDVLPGQSGMYGLVFDNTFSKQTSKTANLVLLTYPTNAPPQGNHVNTTAAAAAASQVSLGRYSTAKGNESADSIPSQPTNRDRGASVSARSEGGGKNYHVGTLSKRRRKKGQGYARRFFSLDYSSCTLSYYQNRASSALRGSIPLSLAAIAADQDRREFVIDSGAEVWHLRAATPKDFTDWAQALEKASRTARGIEGGAEAGSPRAADNNAGATSAPRDPKSASANQQEDREWLQVEMLVSRMVGTRDALRRLVKDMANNKSSHALGIYMSPGASSGPEEMDGYFPQAPEKRPFWKRKSSAQSSPMTPQTFQPTLSSTLAVPSPSVTPLLPNANPQSAKRLSRASAAPGAGADASHDSTHENCDALLKDLDSVVSEFTALIASSKRRRAPPALRAAPARASIDTTSTDEFFDAEAGNSNEQIVRIDRSEDEDGKEHTSDEDGQSSSSGASLAEGGDGGGPDSTNIFPPKPKSLAPLPIPDPIQRRQTIPSAKMLPPSLIGFVRKNVGKDLSTISMPVSANEPTSLLQKFAEQLEFAQLLDRASKSENPTERILLMAAFAISQFSAGRAKERAIRKPFNPLLGETYELLRSEAETPGGMRLLVEKVSHRPVRLAVHADSARWSFAQSPAPGQKFWGKSAEITTEGKIRIVLRLANGSDELYSWNTATMYLRNVVMGEKYVEPAGNMSVVNDSTGAKAAVEFLNKGMFGGRSEDVKVEALNPDGSQTGSGLAGTWTTSLRLVESGKPGAEVWKAGPLIDGAAQKYGMTPFAAALNEVTAVEKGKLPPTDSRLRPDQRLVEDGDLDAAEEWKVRLEEAQRARRRDMEERGDAWKPRWFVRVAEMPDGEEVWRVKGGKEGYWDAREKGAWAGVDAIFDAPEVATAP